VDLPTKTIGIRLPVSEKEVNAQKKKRRASAGEISRGETAVEGHLSGRRQDFRADPAGDPGKGKVINDLRRVRPRRMPCTCRLPKAHRQVRGNRLSFAVGFACQVHGIRRGALFRKIV